MHCNYASSVNSNWLPQRRIWRSHISLSVMVWTLTSTFSPVSLECSSGSSCSLSQSSTFMVSTDSTSRIRNRSPSADGSSVTSVVQTCSVNKWDYHLARLIFAVRRVQYLKPTKLFLEWSRMSSLHSRNAISLCWIQLSKRRAMLTVPLTCHQTLDRPWEKNFSENAEERSTARLVSKTWSVLRFQQLTKLAMMSLTSSFNHLASFHLKNWQLGKFTVSPYLASVSGYTCLCMSVLSILRVFNKTPTLSMM